MKKSIFALWLMMLVGSSYAQSLQIDQATTASLRTELDRLGVKYWKTVRYFPPSEADLKKIPVAFRNSLKNGMCVLDVHGKKGIDLKAISKMPFTHLSLDQTDVRDISPLKNMPLVQLGLRATPVRDISPLSGGKLYEIDLRESLVTDISPLRGMPIERLDLTFTSVSNVDVVAALPQLNTLYLAFTKVHDLRPIKKATQLRRLYLPEVIDAGLDDVRQMTWLTHLAYGDSDFLPVQEFWKKYDAGQLKPSTMKWTPKTEQ